MTPAQIGHICLGSFLFSIQIILVKIRINIIAVIILCFDTTQHNPEFVEGLCFDTTQHNPEFVEGLDEED